MGKSARSKAQRAKAAQKAVAAARGSYRGVGWWIVGAVLVVALAVVLIVAVVNRSSGPNQAEASVPTTPITTASGREVPPPWPAPADPAAAVRAAGLPMLGSEGTVEHIHAHLDVLVDGKPVAVPAGIGIDEAANTISPVHTHDAAGVIHIESPTQAPFSLAQLFTEWQVALDHNRIGGLTTTGGNTLRAYVNGKEVTGNPAAITLQAHDEIALVYGPVTDHSAVPQTYTWPAGE